MFHQILIAFSAVCVVVVSAAGHLPPECVFEKDMEDCCDFANTTEHASDAIMAECDKMYAEKKDYTCATECFLNKTGVMVDGKIDEKKALDLAEFTAEEKKHWDVVMDAAVKKCIGWAEGEEFKMHGDDHQLGCTFKAAFFINCVMGQMFITCPNELWKSSPTCDASKARVKDCRVLIARPEGMAQHA